MPCFELFAAAPAEYRRSVIGTAPRVAIEAAVRQSWDIALSPDDAFIGMSSFGASAPAGELYKKFGITVDAIVAAARALVAQEKTITLARRDARDEDRSIGGGWRRWSRNCFAITRTASRFTARRQFEWLLRRGQPGGVAETGTVRRRLTHGQNHASTIARPRRRA